MVSLWHCYPCRPAKEGRSPSLNREAARHPHRLLLLQLLHGSHVRLDLSFPPPLHSTRAQVEDLADHLLHGINLPPATYEALQQAGREELEGLELMRGAPVDPQVQELVRYRQQLAEGAHPLALVHRSSEDQVWQLFVWARAVPPSGVFNQTSTGALWLAPSCARPVSAGGSEHTASCSSPDCLCT